MLDTKYHPALPASQCEVEGVMEMARGSETPCCTITAKRLQNVVILVVASCSIVVQEPAVSVFRVVLPEDRSSSFFRNFGNHEQEYGVFRKPVVVVISARYLTARYFWLVFSKVRHSQ